MIMDLFLLVFGLVCLFLACDVGTDFFGWSILAFAVGLIFTFTTVFVFVPKDLGWSVVPTAAEKYEKRLEAGVRYELLASVKDGETTILLVRGESKVQAIRVKDQMSPPRYFALIGGNPIETVPPMK